VSRTKPSATSPGQRIATALRRSPIYADPSYASALTPAQRATLLKLMKRSGYPIFVILVPYVAGGTWSSSDELLSVVHDRLGVDGAYVTLDDEFTGDLTATQYPPDARTADNTSNAASAVGLEDSMQNAPLAARLTRCVNLILSGTGGTAAYNAASAALNDGRTTPSAAPSHRGGGGDAAPIVGGVAGAVVLGLAGLAVWRWRRTRSRPVPAVAPRRVFDSAERAGEDALRERADKEIIALGTALDASDVNGVPASAAGADEAGQRLSTALDAYAAAEKVLDAASGLPDLAGVLVLLDQGRDALAAAEALAAGRPAPEATPLCFFNPLHGDGDVTIDWRPLGSRQRVKAHACRSCAKAARGRETPDALMDGGVPYFEADPDRSVWAVTGYGQLRDDLIQRVLRGDLHRA
jgi:hypothetical protein